MKKKLTCYVLFIITILFLILGADESTRPLIITGDSLRRETGSVDGSTLSIHQESGYSGLLASTLNYMLDKGQYTLGIEYRTDTHDNSLKISDNGSTLLTNYLNPSYTYAEIPFTLEKDSQEVIIELSYSGVGTLSVTSLQLMPAGHFYHDAYFFAGLFVLLNILAVLLLRSRCFRQMSQESKMIFFVLIAVAIASSVPLFNSYLNWADDLCYHLIRIEGIKDGLLDGQFPVVIYPEGLYGNGYLNCMYPSLFLYIPAFFRILGVSMTSSYKVFICLFNLLTVFITYYSVKTLSASRKAALLVSIVYVLCPYRFTNVYARGAVGEFLAMAFMPLLLAGLYHVLLADKKKWWMLVLGLSGLIQTHVLSAVLGAIFCVIFGILYLAVVICEKRYFSIIKAAIMTLLLNLWYIVPFIYFYVRGGLWTSALDWCTFSEYSMNLSGLLGTLNSEDYRTLTLGLPIAFCAVVCMFSLCFDKRRDRIKSYLTSLFVLGCICTFMVINQFPGWPLMELKPIEFLLKNIQFAWRLLGPASILLTIPGCVFLYRLDVLKPYRKGLFLLLAGITLLSTTRYQADDFAYQNYYDTFTVGHQSKLRGIPKGDNTIVYPFEWRPEGTIDAELYTGPVFTDPSVTELLHFSKDGTTAVLSYVCTQDGQSVSIPLIHYAGYQAYDEIGNELPIVSNRENNTVHLSLIGDSQEHQIVVEYKGLLRFTFAFYISICSVTGWLFLTYRTWKHPTPRIPRREITA